MTNQELKQILDRIPAKERQSARNRITAAELAGWSCIELWCWLTKEQLTEQDLVGENAKGEFGFLP